MRYTTGKSVWGEKLRSVTHYITGLIGLKIEFAIIYARMVEVRFRPQAI